MGWDDCDSETWRHDDTHGPCPWPNSSSRGDGCRTTPTYFNCSPKACWVSGKLKNWSVVEEMHGESGEQGASRFINTIHATTFDLTSAFNSKSKQWLPWASKNSSSELSSESRAMLCILHSEMLWRDGLTEKPQMNKKFTVILVTCVSASLFPFLNTHTHTPYNKEILHNLLQPTHTQCYINMQQSLWFITSSQMDCLVVRGCAKSEAQFNKDKLQAHQQLNARWGKWRY